MVREWVDYSLGEVTVTNDSTYSPKEAWPFVNYLDTSSITENKIEEIQHLVTGIDKIPSRARRKVAEGDVVYSNVRPNQKHYGIIRNPPENFLVSTGFTTIRANPNLADTNFIYWFLSQASVTEFLQTIGENTASAYPSIKPSDIEGLNIPPPPLPEQKAIAHVLGSLDDKIELNRRMNETLEGMAQALFKSWIVDFDPVIDNALAAGNPIPEPLAQCAETRRQAIANGTANRESAQAFPASFRFTEELGWIPEGWEVKKIIEEVNLVMGQSPSSDHYNQDGKGLPFHQGVTNYGERFPKHEQFSTGGNRIAEKGDILFSVRAPVGRINIADQRLIIGRGLSALRHDMDCQSYLVYFLKSFFQKEDSIGSGTIFNAVTKKDMENIPLISPSKELILAFNVKGDSFDARIPRNTKESQTLAKLRDVLLPKLISGELRIPQAEKMVEEAIS